MSTTTHSGSLRQRRQSSQFMSPLNIPPLDNSEPVRPVVIGNSDINSEVTEEGRALFTGFVLEEIQREPELDIKDNVLGIQKNNRNSVWAQAGAKLQQMASDFACTAERQRVRQQANQMGVNVNQEEFRDLLSQLFASGGTSERIVAVFFFSSDVAINALRVDTSADRSLFHQFINWSLDFITDHVCQWVYRHGGWGQVLRSPFNSVHKIGFWVAFSVGAVLVLGYIRFRYLH